MAVRLSSGGLDEMRERLNSIFILIWRVKKTLLGSDKELISLNAFSYGRQLEIVMGLLGTQQPSDRLTAELCFKGGFRGTRRAAVNAHSQPPLS